MPTLLAARLSAARQRQFVGREGEQRVFRAALEATVLPFCVLYIYGPGGIGKTTLLRQFVQMSQQAHVVATYLDARDVDPSPDSFLNALHRTLQLTPGASLYEALAATSDRQIILIDTFEHLMPLDAWLRDQFLPQLPDNILIVFSGREPPALGWRADAGWQTLIHILPLRNLDPDESRSYLARRNLPVEQHPTILDFTHGHPLALSLVADVFAQRRDVQFQPQHAPDVIKILLEEFVQKVPSPAHRTALEACALVRIMTEALLTELLGMPDAHELFEWLRTLSFIESGSAGLFPHDLAREALVADLRWRNRDWYAELHRRARTYYARLLQQTQGHEQQRVMFDYVFLHRENPLVRPFLEWQDSGSGVPTGLMEHDIPVLLTMITDHEGSESSQLAAHWLALQPANATVYRTTTQQPAGLLLSVELQAATDEHRRLDPATNAAWAFLQRRAPLRPDQRATMFRFWMARDTYQAVSAVQSMIFVNIAQYYMNTPGLAYTFFTCADPQFWEPAFAYMDLSRIDEIAFTVGQRTYGVFTHDWRVVPPLAWLDLLAEREIASEPLEYRPAVSASTVVVLSQAEFEAAVRTALHHFVRPTALRTSPLVRSRLVMERTGPQTNDAERVSELQRIIKRAAEQLQATPREAKYYRALYHTYFQPAPTQERASELLNVPFSSYRRHLQAGLAKVAEILWQWELSGPDT